MSVFCTELSCAPQISPYDYERLQVVLEVLHSQQKQGLKTIGSPERGLKLLELLHCYTRTTPPQEEEKEWFAGWKKGAEVRTDLHWSHW